MLMTGATGVNSGGPPRAIMMSVGEIARRDGVAVAGVSRRVKQLRERGLQVELDGQGRVTAVNSVQYDELRNRFADPSKAQATRPIDQAVSESYDEALRQKTWTEAERARLRLEEEKGRLVPVDRLADALAQAGEKIVRAIDLIMSGADDIAAAVAKDGAAGVRTELKRMAHRTKADIADALAAIAAGAPEGEEE